MHNIKEFIDMNENDFDSFFNILDNSIVSFILAMLFYLIFNVLILLKFQVLHISISEQLILLFGDRYLKYVNL